MSTFRVIPQRMKQWLGRPLVARIKKTLGVKTIHRIDACNQLLRTINGSTYLEIGVAAGNVLQQVQAARRIGVDPNPRPAGLSKQADVQYFALESDRFFNCHAEALFANEPIDVALIDGLHQYQQALRDIEHSLTYLGHNGVILVHDCNPPTRFRGLPPGEDREQERARLQRSSMRLPGAWEGDVWKAIVQIRSQRTDLRAFVLDCDHGLGVISKGSAENMLGYSPNEIANMTFDDLASDRVRLLNLKPPTSFDGFLNAVRMGVRG